MTVGTGIGQRGPEMGQGGKADPGRQVAAAPHVQRLPGILQKFPHTAGPPSLSPRVCQLIWPIGLAMV